MNFLTNLVITIVWELYMVSGIAFLNKCRYKYQTAFKWLIKTINQCVSDKHLFYNSHTVT